MNFDLQKLIDALKEFAFQFFPKIIGAISVWIIGIWVIRFIGKGLKLIFEKSNLDVSLKTFLLNLIKIALKILLLITALGILGVQMTSFIAILGAVGLAFGMAMSGTFQNFAGGIMLLLFKPIRVGDLIQTQGYTGVVKEIQIFVTILVTPDHKTVILPNGIVANNEITNYAKEGTIRVDLEFGISYDTSI